jgi:hypothetical protein
MPIDADLIRANGWRQGKAFTVSDSHLMLRDYADHSIPRGVKLSTETRLLLVSHSCDVVCRREVEHLVEVCPATPISDHDGLDVYGYGRDPRRLRIHMAVGSEDSIHELHAPTRFYMDRSRLETMRPDPVIAISDENFLILEQWLAARVVRRVFPDEFDRRLSTKNHKKIRKVLQDTEPFVRKLLYSIRPHGELEGHEPYGLKVVLLARSEHLFNERERLQTAVTRIKKILDRPGINADVVLASDDQFTYKQFVGYADWGFEDLSFKRSGG